MHKIIIYIQEIMQSSRNSYAENLF